MRPSSPVPRAGGAVEVSLFVILRLVRLLPRCSRGGWLLLPAPAPAAAPASFAISVCSAWSLAEPRQPFRNAAMPSLWLVLGVGGDSSSGWREGGEGGGVQAAASGAAERLPLKISLCKIHLQKSALPLRAGGSRLLVPAHSRRRRQDVEVLLLLQPLGFWLKV